MLKSYNIEKPVLIIFSLSILIFLFVMIGEKTNINFGTNKNKSFDILQVQNKIDEVLKSSGVVSIKRKEIKTKLNPTGRTEVKAIFQATFDQIVILQKLQNEFASDSIKVQGSVSAIKGVHLIHLSRKKKVFETIFLQLEKKKIELKIEKKKR